MDGGEEISRGFVVVRDDRVASRDRVGATP
jgi:hypothetical protein